jgi:Asp-tRNA(Asn)/Glu-tRNA(Gln) amidotransferase A subunit family amidase
MEGPVLSPSRRVFAKRLLLAVATPAIAVDALAQTAPPRPPPKGGKPRRFRIGVIKGTSDKVQPEVRKNFEDALKPALSLPNGFGEKGLPTAFQFTGRAFSDETLVALGTAYQARTEWHVKRPPL